MLFKKTNKQKKLPKNIEVTTLNKSKKQQQQQQQKSNRIGYAQEREAT